MEEKIELEDLTSLHKEYAKVIGIDNLIALSKHFGGMPIYIPKYEKLAKYSRYKKALNDYKKGMLIKDIVKKYKISERTVYNLIGKTMGKSVLDEQMNIYDFI